VLGEGREGLLVLLAEPDSARAARWLRDLASAENHDREVLMRRALQLTPELGPDQLSVARQAFCRLVRQTAKPGHRLQRADGQWEVAGQTKEQAR
jgi:hypothetical protein